MENDLKEKLLDLKNNYDYKEINEYFATEFSDDYYIFERDEKNIKILEFLNDSFIDIDIDYSKTEEFEKKVNEVIDIALSMFI